MKGDPIVADDGVRVSGWQEPLTPGYWRTGDYSPGVQGVIRLGLATVGGQTAGQLGEVESADVGRDGEILLGGLRRWTIAGKMTAGR